MPNGSSQPLITRRYYPALSSVVTHDDIPDILGFIKDGILTLFDKVHYKDLQYSKSAKGDAASYSLSIVSADRLDIELPGTGIFFVLNPDLTSGDSTISAFPITIEYQWKILAYLRALNLSDFSFDPQSFFEMALRVLNVTEEQVMAQFINVFVKPANDSVTHLQQFVTDINDYLGASIAAPTDSTSLSQVVQQIYTASGNQYSSVSAFGKYLLVTDVNQTLTNVKDFFKAFIPQNIDDVIRDILIPKFKAALKLIAAIEFPRTMLVPVHPENTVINGENVSFQPIADPAKAMFTFAEAQFYADTTRGFGYSVDLLVNSVSPVQIGNTGLILDIHNLKVDLSTSSNIPEAGDRPLDFMGVYVEEAEIILPPKWFAEATTPGQAPKIFGRKLLIGTGGISGTVGLEGSGTLHYTFANGLALELVSFDITFESGAIVSSSILGNITIPIPDFQHNPLNIRLDIENGFKVQVLIPEGNGIPIIDNSNILLTLDGLTIGRQQAVWELGFAAKFMMKRSIPLLTKAFPKIIDVNNFSYKSDGSQLDYDFRVDWESGAFIQGSNQSGVTAYFPINRSIGGDLFKVDGLQLKVTSTATNEAKFEVLLRGVAFEIGPVSGSVDGFGTDITIKKQETGGNLGPFNADMGFIGPKGIGLQIDNPVISGGGYLYIGDGEYIGAVELTLKQTIGLSALGILTTKLPAGESGYSLLVIITAKFSPIPIGLGFTLNAVGGILGLHRTMDPDFLRNGIREKTLDSILFPQDVAKNAHTIISNVKQAFPVKKGQFLFGPMAKIGYGSPNFITIDLGIIIELPDPVRLAILGVLRALLPANKPVLKLQINFLGIIDFTNKYLSFDASLYESTLLSFPLSGDMALRLYWGDKPNFLISVGGFHPKYTPPPMNLPQMRRLGIALSKGKALTINVETYFALTSNSAQFGARVYASAKAGPAMVEGALWFDILFQFSPFHFIADMGVMFAVKVFNKEIMSLFVDLTLEGPNPWHASGKGTFKILFVKYSARFDKTFGDVSPEAIEAVETFGKVRAAIELRDNWQSLLPARSNQLVAYREIPLSDTTLMVDPAGALVFSQKVLPLNMELQKFGTSAIKDYNKYGITVGTLTSGTISTVSAKVSDYFARNEFFYMKDDEKLSKDSYEKFESGLNISTNGGIVIDSFVHRNCHYEEIVIDSGIRERKLVKKELSVSDFECHIFGGYVSRSPLSKFGSKTIDGGPKKVAVKEGKYKVADKNSFAAYNPAGEFDNYTMAEKYLRDLAVSNPTAAADLLVAHEFEIG